MRAFLGGYDLPRAELALGGLGENTGIPLILLLEDGEVFTAEDYISLGYTNYEVWCVGAAGGRGGAFYSMRRDPFYSGGAGGGGGLHRAHGLLVDLPVGVAVDVGLAGANGRNASSGWPKNPVLDGTGWPATPLSMVTNPNYVTALPGGDGGASSFGTICRASGGKGGDVARQGPQQRYLSHGPTDYEQWQVSVNGRAIPGNGGEGGLGNRLLAGGGGAGGESEYVDLLYNSGGGFTGPYGGHRVFTKPGDGSWDGDIGSGGGGGVGELDRVPQVDFGTPDYTVLMQRAAIGGKGSFSYADTTVYGPGATSFFTDDLPKPGGGGGARIPGNRKYGSEAAGYSRDGAVLVRLTKVE